VRNYIITHWKTSQERLSNFKIKGYYKYNFKRGASMKSSLIAPCGMNCNLCIGYLREKNRCLGCRENDENILNSCRKCIIKNCTILQQKKLKYCSSKCEKFLCTRLKNLDKRYRTKYQMSMLENLQFIEEFGIRKFVDH